MSFKVGVKTAGDKEWVYNGLRFGSKEEAENYEVDLVGRWFAVTGSTVTESDDPANYILKDGKLISLAETQGEGA